MNYDPKIHNRQSIRLQGFDYSQPATYFITFCTNNKLCLFGNVKNEHVILNDEGKLIVEQWKSLEIRFPKIICDAFIVMPNHIHAIVAIPAANNSVNFDSDERFPYIDPFAITRTTPSSNANLSEVIRYFKSKSTHSYSDAVRQGNAKRFQNRLWQRSFFDRIIRNAKDHEFYRNYMETNPIRWK